MNQSGKCPHCNERTELIAPEAPEGEDYVEVSQDCERCARPIVARFAVVFRLREIVGG